jgi:hypothetical protein
VNETINPSIRRHRKSLSVCDVDHVDMNIRASDQHTAPEMSVSIGCEEDETGAEYDDEQYREKAPNVITPSRKNSKNGRKIVRIPQSKAVIR